MVILGKSVTVYVCLRQDTSGKERKTTGRSVFVLTISLTYWKIMKTADFVKVLGRYTCSFPLQKQTQKCNALGKTAWTLSFPVKLLTDKHQQAQLYLLQ